MSHAPKPPSGKARILVVDDHPLFREGVRQLIDRQNDLVCCGEAGTVAATTEAVAQLKPDLLLLDLRLGSGDGLDLIKSLRAQAPTLAILVISQFDELHYAERALRAGARGYLMKEEATEEVLSAMRVILAGDRYVSRRMTPRLLDRLLEGPSARTESRVDCLSDRELQVFQLLGSGMSTRAIAESLNLSFKTIETYRENVKHKLGLSGATDLIRTATEWVGRQGLPGGPSQFAPPD